MQIEKALRALEEHLQAQGILATACCDQAFAAQDWRLRSAWIGHFTRILEAMTAAGNAVVRLQAAGGRPPPPASPPSPPRLPSLPLVPEEEEDPLPPPFSRKQPPKVSAMDRRGYPPPLAGSGSSPAKRGRGTTRSVVEGADADSPPALPPHPPARPRLAV